MAGKSFIAIGEELLERSGRPAQPRQVAEVFSAIGMAELFTVAGLYLQSEELLQIAGSLTDPESAMVLWRRAGGSLSSAGKILFGFGIQATSIVVSERNSQTLTNLMLKPDARFRDVPWSSHVGPYLARVCMAVGTRLAE